MEFRETACAVTNPALSKWHADLCYSTILQLGSISVEFLEISWNIMENGLSAKGSASATFTKTTLGFCSDHVDLIGSVVGRS